jgi:hypothetical protein
MAQLRKGKTKSLLEASIDSALLAVEIYNKPRTTFRSEAYISLMIMAWLRLFHAHLNVSIGDRYYYKNKNGRYDTVDGERKAWELSTCIKKCGNLDAAQEKNLEFFIKLRNKIEHRHINKRDIDHLIFGECQSLLYNYETTLINLFGEEYSINESLVYSLQFSHLRTSGQKKSNKSALSKDLMEVMGFVEKFRNGLEDSIYDSMEYSVKLIQVPKISNTNRADAAIEFVKWDSLSAEDKEAYEKISVLIKDKKVTVQGVNVKRFKPSEVVSEVNANINGVSITSNLHVTLYKIFEIRPINGADDPFDTKSVYCLYDETHGDYVYEQAWVDFLIHFMQTQAFTAAELRAKEKAGDKMDIKAYEI